MDLTRTIHKKMIDGHLMFVYRGDINEKNSMLLLTLLENEMKYDSYGLTGRKRLFMFVLESLQNITRHGDHKRYADMSLVIFSRTEDGYTITTGNIIDNNHVENLRARLENVSKLEPEEIKNQYRQILISSGFSEKGGAGLGLMEMAIKTGNKLNFDFTPVDDQYSYFMLSKTVDSAGMGVHPSDKDNQFQNGDIVRLEQMMSENKIYLLWSGHVSADIGEDVLSLTETRLVEEDVEADLRKKVFSIMVEIFENVSKYNPGRESEEKYGNPLVIIRFENNGFNLTTGNLIYNSMVDDLKEKIENINSHNKEELKNLYYKSLSEQTIDNDSTGNMGLMSVARKSGTRLEYLFEKVNELFSYYMLTVKIGTGKTTIFH